eukprot:Tamp_28140.p2 GENE.Tamp_28140~~Tamp_28140.p2  ORF type:complete len:104 (+),score=10.81 Tamp_28140:82-393(+)
MVSLPQGVMPSQSSFFKSGYSTTKSVRIYSWRVILVYCRLCLTVAVYLLIYMMFWHRGTRGGGQSSFCCCSSILPSLKILVSRVRPADGALAARRARGRGSGL